MTFLQQLYAGNLCPAEQIASQNAPAEQAEAFSAYEAFRNTLGEKARQAFDRMLAQQLELWCKDNETHYLEGFRHGARMMLETLGAPKP